MGWTKSSHIVVVAAYIHLLFCSEFGSTAHPGSSASRLHLCVSCSMLHWKYTQERKKDVLLIMLSSWIYLSTILWRPVLSLSILFFRYAYFKVAWFIWQICILITCIGNKTIAVCLTTPKASYVTVGTSMHNGRRRTRRAYKYQLLPVTFSHFYWTFW